MKADILGIRLITATLLILNVFSFSPAKSSTDTCGLNFIESALKTGQIKRNEYEHFISFRNWLVEVERPCSSFVSDIKDRITTLSDTTSFSIDTSGLTFIGNPSAPIQIVIYVSLSCPLCKRIYRDLYDSLTSGSLRDKAKLAVKPFGINTLNCIMVAASHWGKQSELLRAVAPIKERLTLEMVLQVTDSLNIPVESLRYWMESQKTMEYIRKSHEEAIKNGISVTPTLFINTHRYKSYKDSRWIIDAAKIIYERLNKKQ